MINRRSHRIFALFLAALGSTGLRAQSPKPATSPQKATQAVHDAEQKWLNSLFALDVAAMESTESPDFQLVTPSMALTRQAHLTAMRAQTRHGVPANPQLAVSVSNQTINLYGDVAVVSDVCSVMTGDSVINPGRYWQTEVWHKEGATWKIVYMQISAMQHGM
jgi:ketosteroid isomerase-like protein